MIYFLPAFIIVVFFYLFYQTDLESNDLLNSKKKYLSNYLFVIASLFGVLFSGIRYQVGTDWQAYQEAFENKIFVNFEVGYTLLTTILRINGFSFEFLQLFVSCFYGLLCYLIFRLCVNKWIGLVLLNANMSALYFGGNRQGIALSISMLATFLFLASFQKGKLNTIILSSAGLLLALATSFHTSIIVFVIVLTISFLLKNKVLLVTKVTVIFSLITIISGGKNPFAPLVGTLSKLTQLGNIEEYVSNTESGILESDPTRAIVIIIYNLVVVFLIHRSLKLNFHTSQNSTSKANREYYSIIVNLIMIFYFIFCLYLGVSRDASGRLLIYGRMFECVFFGSLSYQYLYSSKQNNLDLKENKFILKSTQSQYFLIINSIVLLSLVKVYFTFLLQEYYFPYRTYILPGMDFY